MLGGRFFDSAALREAMTEPGGFMRIRPGPPPTAASREIGGCHLPHWGEARAGCGFARDGAGRSFSLTCQLR